MYARPLPDLYCSLQPGRIILSNRQKQRTHTNDTNTQTDRQSPNTGYPTFFELMQSGDEKSVSVASAPAAAAASSSASASAAPIRRSVPYPKTTNGAQKTNTNVTGMSATAPPVASSISSSLNPSDPSSSPATSAPAPFVPTTRRYGSLTTLEARISGQVAQAQALASSTAQSTDAQAAAASSSSSSSSSSTLPHLPSTGGTTNLRLSTLNVLGSSGGAPLTPNELNPLGWSDIQFKRAGVGVGGGIGGGGAHLNSIPIGNLGLQQRTRHSELFSVVEKIRESQQHIFLDQFNQLPNVDERHTSEDYSKIWHAFKAKDEEAQHIIGKLNTLCEHIDTLNKHTNKTRG